MGNASPPAEEPLAMTVDDFVGSEDSSVAGLPEHERAALMGVGFEPTGIDAIAGRSGIGMRELLSALSLLELKGYVRRDAGGSFVRSPVARAGRG